MMVDIGVSVGERNGDGKRDVTYRLGEQTYPDTIDPQSGFQREQSVRRAMAAFGVEPDNLSALDAEIARLAAEADKTADGAEDKPSEPPPFTRLFTGAELLALDLKPRFLVRGIMVEGQPMIIGGRSKTLKTSLACDLAISLGSGTPFLGWFDAHRVGVGFWSGESGAATIRETAKRIAAARGVDLTDAACLWCFNLPRLSHRDHLDHLAATIRGEGLKVAIFDPLYLALLSPETASGASNVFLMGSMLQGLTKLGQDTGCTVVLLHHFRKGGQPDDDNPAGLEELAQIGRCRVGPAMASLAAAVCIPGRRKPLAVDALRGFCGARQSMGREHRRRPVRPRHI